METGPRNNIRDLVVDPESFIPDLSEEKVRQLKSDLDIVCADFSRSVAIMYLSSNYSSNKHLANTVLNSLHDEDLREYLDKVRVVLDKEIESRHH